MTEETFEDTDQGDEGIDPRVILAGIMGGGPKSIHEIGVQGSVIEQTVNLVERYSKPEIRGFVMPDGAEVPYVVRQGQLEYLDSDDFDQWRDAPLRRKGTAKLFDVESLIAFVKRHADEDSVIFADNNRNYPKITAVLDYNRADVGDTKGEPRFGEHRASFEFPLSDEWKAWHAHNGVGHAFTQGGFAAFIEDRIIDVLPVAQINLNDEQGEYIRRLGGDNYLAEPARLMELSQGLRIVENSETSESVNLSNGDTQVTFKKEGVPQGQAAVPRMFAIAIPVVTNGPLYQVLVRLRTRSTGGRVSFFYDLWRTDRVFDHAFDEVLARVHAATLAPVLLGAPE